MRGVIDASNEQNDPRPERDTVSDELNQSMFRAYDIRTPSSLLTDDLAVRLADAEAVYFRDVLGVKGVLLSYDARRTGPRYLTLTADVLLKRDSTYLSAGAGLDLVLLFRGDAASGVCGGDGRRIAQPGRRYGPENPRPPGDAHRRGYRTRGWLGQDPRVVSRGHTCTADRPGGYDPRT